MTIQQLGYFLKLCEDRNFTSVARIFFITQPTLSRQIVNLENELKVTLFDRDHNTVRLTQEGQLLYDRLKPVFMELMDIIRDVQNLREDKDMITIGVEEEQIVSSSLQLALNRMRYEYPEVKISIHRGQIEELVEGLQLGRYDLINMLDFPTISYDKEFSYMELESEYACMAIARASEKCEGAEFVTKQEFAELIQEYPLLFPNVYKNMDDDGAKAMFLQNFGLDVKNGLKPEQIVVYQTGRPISLPTQVSAQMGISVCNESSFASISPDIRFPKIEGMEDHYSKGLFFRKEQGNLYLKTLLKLVSEEHIKSIAASQQ